MTKAYIPYKLTPARVRVLRMFWHPNTMTITISELAAHYPSRTLHYVAELYTWGKLEWTTVTDPETMENELAFTLSGPGATLLQQLDPIPELR